MAEDTINLDTIVVNRPSGQGGDDNGPTDGPDNGINNPNGINSSTNPSTSQTSDGLNTLSNGDLPWAKVLLPTTSAGHSGIGENRHGVKPQTWVYGIFLDGDSAQQPLILGVLSGGPGGGSGRAGGGGDGSTGSSDSTINTSGATGGNNAEKVYSVLVKNGYSAEQASGIIGNLLNEGKNLQTGDLNPTQNEYGGGGGYGIAQWTDAGRKNALRNFSKGGYNTIEGQTAFLIHELRTTEKKAGQLLENSRNSVRDSTIAFMNFERPKEGFSVARYRATGNGVDPNNANTKKRISSAEAFYRKISSKSSSSPVDGSLTKTPTSTQRQPGV